MLKARGLHTVCEEARCPNIGECWAGGTATFMLLGDVCTRACRFCAVKSGNPGGRVDPLEAQMVAEACEIMGLSYVVLTSVDRDDLEDGGAGCFAKAVRATKQRVPGIRVEALVPDFAGREASIDTILGSGVDVFAQNLETVKRLTYVVRDPKAGYEQTLLVLRLAKQKATRVVTKSSLMLGLGESERELEQAFLDLREAGVDVLTLGQYLRPSLSHLPVKEYVTPARFEALRLRALKMGFAYVASGPLVRSSYKAAEYWSASRLGDSLEDFNPVTTT